MNILFLQNNKWAIDEDRLQLFFLFYLLLQHFTRYKTEKSHFKKYYTTLYLKNTHSVL